MAKKRRRHRRFNGMGSVYMMPGHRARPWAARVIKERREDGKYSYAYTFHETAVEAALAIPEMIKQLKETPQSDLTVNQIWERFKETRYLKLSDATIKGYDSSYAHWAALHGRRIAELKTSDLQAIINMESEMSYSHLSKLRALMVAIFETAMKDDIVAKNYASLIELPKGEPEGTRRAFTDDELGRIRQASDSGVPYADVVLFMCYMGWRPTEMCLLTKESVDLKEWFILGGIKTKAGKGRVVPVHSSVRLIVTKWLEKGYKTLFTDEEGNALDKDKWGTRFSSVVNALHLDETLVPYTTRHTCATLLHAAGADPLSIAKILGHEDYKTTAKTYTHPVMYELKSAMELIK